MLATSGIGQPVLSLGLRDEMEWLDLLPASISTSPPWLCPGPEITDELVRVLRRRLDEATLDVITVMLVRNCKLTPADVEVSSLPGSLRDSTTATRTVAARNFLQL